MMRRLASLLLLLLVAGCAAIQPPPGGKEDKTPPKIEEVTPAPQSLNVSRTTKLHFQFQHNLDRSSFTNAITITPYMSGVVKYDWSGYDEVTVNLPDTLRANTTYIVTLTKDLKTIRGGALTEPYQLVFSTGPAIDTGFIQGNILPAITTGAAVDLKNVSVFAYDISTISADTLHLDRVRPDYITQPTEKGVFEFRAMKPSHTYRMFAIVDEFRNRVFDPGIDAYGMPNGDVELRGASRYGVRIRMMPKADTSKPQLTDAEANDVYHIRARFSKALDSASVCAWNFTLADSATGVRLPVAAAFRGNIEKAAGTVMLMLGAPMTKNAVYKLTALGSVHDMAGNALDTGASVSWIRPLSARDTFAAPHFGGIPFPDSIRGVLPEFMQVLSFSDAVDTAAFEAGLRLFDSTNKPVTLQFIWLDGIRVRVETVQPLLPRALYRFEFKGVSVVPPSGVHATANKDTTIITHFFTAERTEYGTVSGSVTTADSSRSGGSIVVRLISSDGAWNRTLSLPAGSHDYIFDKVPKNRYRVQAWLTERPDRGYEGGTPIPLKFALPSGDYPDEIDVRPKWTLEHIDIQLQ